MSDNIRVRFYIRFLLQTNFLLVACLLAPSLASAIQIDSPCPASSAIPGEFLVRIKRKFSASESFSEKSGSIFLGGVTSRKIGFINTLKSSNSQEKVANDSGLSAIETHFLEIDDFDVQSLSLSTDGEILSVERNCYVHAMAIPSDPLTSSNIGLNLISAPKAWDIAHDSQAVVAVIDTGVDLAHEDLTANLWKNTAELRGLAGVDDDQNGYVDDIYGWGFHEKTADPSPGNYDGADHGTHVAGIIGAAGGNGLGTTGVAWSVKIMPLRVFSKTANDAATSDIIESIYYAVNNGAQIINCSWGAEQSPSQAELDAYKYADSKGVLVVAAAGNDSKDASLYTPAVIASVLAVGSINSQLQMSSFSNFGETVSVLAPGGDVVTSFGTGINEQIFSSLPGNSYGFKRGTSASAPFVSGLAALIKSILPKIDAQNLKSLIKNSGDFISVKKQGVASSYSFLNAQKALAQAVQIGTKNPNCSDNCVLSGSTNFSSTLSPVITKFGGGGCSGFKAADDSKSAASSPWDLAFLFSVFTPALIANYKKIVRYLIKK